MINIQKRYIYSAFLSGISFIIFYSLLDFYFYISLIFALGVYIAGIFLFKGKDLRMYDARALAKYQFEMSKLNNYKEKINDKTIKERLGKIVSVSQKIAEHLNTKPTSATKIYNFLDYYLPFTNKIVAKYINAESKKEKTFVENQLILKMSVYIKEVTEEFERLLAEIIKSKDKTFNFEMKIFEKSLNLDFDDEKEVKKK